MDSNIKITKKFTKKCTKKFDGKVNNVFIERPGLRPNGLLFS